MILGLPPLVFLHTLIGIVAFGAGIVVVAGIFRSRLLGRCTAFFLGMMILTDLIGFTLPAPGFLPSRAVGFVWLVLLLAAVIARYVRHLVGLWRPIYAVAAVFSLYFDVLVLVPAGSEPPLAIVKGITLLVFIGLAITAALRFRPARR